MKEKIDKFSKGIFEYEQPEIKLSEDVLNIFIDSGSTKEGSFIITNSQSVSMKGLLYSSSKCMQLSQTTFVGNNCEIFYVADATYLEAGEHLEGQINIVSDCGERQIPFIISVLGATRLTSMGHIGNIFQFTNLAKTAWPEAAALFKQDIFYTSVIRKEKKLETQYNILKKGPDDGLVLEEFLCLNKKKNESGFFIGTSEINADAERKEFIERIFVSKNNWGYLKLKVKSDSDFIVPQRIEIGNDDFISGKFELRILIKADMLKEGIHTGSVTIYNAKHEVVIPVTVKIRSDNETGKLALRRIKSNIKRLMELYLSYSSGKINGGVYIAESIKLSEMMIQLLDKERSSGNIHEKWMTKRMEQLKLYRAYLAYLEEDKFQNEEIIAGVLLKKNEYEVRENRLFAGILYLEAIKSRNKTLTDTNLEKIKRCFAKYPDSPMILWIMLQMDPRLEENKEYRYSSILNAVRSQNPSPTIISEAAKILKEDPFLLKSADSIECMIMLHMLKYDMAVVENGLEFVSKVSGKGERTYLQLDVLTKLYDKFDNTEILRSLCETLIALDIRDSSYHDFFEKAVSLQINIPELYEYYLYTYGDDFNKPIQQSALLYFGYNTSVPDERLEKLYAHVVTKEENNKQIYRAYLKNTEQFAINQIKKGRISDALSVIYSAIMNKQLIDQTILDPFSDILFTYSVQTNISSLKSVVVLNAEEEEEKEYRLDENGHADILMYTDSCEAYFVDEEGNRFAVSECGTISRYIHMQDMLANCYDLGGRSDRLILHMWDKYGRYGQDADAYTALQKQVLRIGTLKSEIRNNICYELANYYYDNYDGDLLDAYLLDIDLDRLKHEERLKMLELMTVRNMYQKVIAAAKQYGIDGMSPKKLSKLCTYAINSELAGTEEETIIALSYYAYKNGDIPEELLQYLANKYNGTTLEMFEIWNAAKDAGLDTLVLEENILAQMLFTECYIENSYRVFMSYYFKAQNRKLVRAYISYTSYKYFVKDRVTNNEFFSVLRADPSLENSQICILALLKFYSQKEKFTEEERSFSDTHIREFLRKKMFFAFFKDFKDKISLPTVMVDKCYIEYRTDPSKSVNIHYSYNGEDDFRTELMNNVGYGIFTKEIILFHGETLQYYITESDGSVEEITESQSIRYLDEGQHLYETRYDEINNILVAIEMNDEKTTIELLERFYKTEYAMKRHFQPL